MVEIPVEQIAAEARSVPPEFVLAEVDRASIKIKDIRLTEDENDDEQQIPLIDLSPLFSCDNHDEEAVAAVRSKIGKACEEWGFFQVVHHGIPESLLESLMKEGSEFFDLPLEKKLRLQKGADKQIWYARNLKSSVRPWSDALNYRCKMKPPSGLGGLEHFKPGFREILDKYWKETVRLAKVFTTVLSEYYQLEPTSFQDGLQSEPDAWPEVVVVFNLYPSCPEPELVLGLRPHADSPALTILLQDEVGGLEVLKDGKWFAVKPRKNALIVNIGNQLEILTNGRLKSAVHRAVVNKHSRRISIGAFCGPAGKDVKVGPMEQFIDEKHPAIFDTVDWYNYVRAFLTKGYDDYEKPLSASFLTDFIASGEPNTID